MPALESRLASASLFPYELTAELPFVLPFAQRRKAADYLVNRGSQSDGSTTGQDGSSGGTEDFDWLTDD